VSYRPDRRDLVLEHIRQAREALAHAERAVHQDDLDLADLECSAAKRACRSAEYAACVNDKHELVELEFYQRHDDKIGINRGLIVRGPERSIMTGAGSLWYALREYFGREGS
jgi:uncharacterized membrane protein